MPLQIKAMGEKEDGPMNRCVWTLIRGYHRGLVEQLPPRDELTEVYGSH